ncbi:MAG TPA: exodeoxyribonuclease VII large subunit, partial [Gammaproteobacteria bacterium]|nr:exodeoxyribonuclease VII large subunit [Gammaproteobacteria bacterium]
MIELNVPFMEKDEAKRLGARWNGASKRWYVPSGVDATLFARWLPDDVAVLDDIVPETSGALEKQTRTEYSLSAFLYKVSDVIQRHFATAAWISAEISELRTNKGHMFITLVEHDDQGNMMARTSARIWQTQVEQINGKFALGTGSNLEAGIKVLVFARVEFHPQYGMSLFIDDIDPSYTLGDMAAKLAKIREVLTAEKIIHKNKELPKPIDFTRVAVISPQNAAGLGDFNREAEILRNNNLCDFVYFTALFQGEGAPKEICRALDLALKEHANKPFDAIVIIRGGGALSDLAWLNNEQLARAVCLCPVHVMAGIGHERDYTIIDEVAGERFDTPSKVIQRIFNLITGNAIEAENRYQEISQAALNIVHRIEERIGFMYQQIGTQAQQYCVMLEKQLQSLISEILSQSPKQILRKGFALISARDGRVVTSKEVAVAEQH